MLRLKRGVRAASVVCAAAIAMGVAACGSDDATQAPATAAAATNAAATEPANIAVFAYNTTSYAAAMVKAAKEAAAKANVNLTTFDGKSDGSVQAVQIQDAMQRDKYQGFLVMAQDAQRILPLINQATQKGIKVVNVDATLGPAEQQESLKPTEGLTSTIGLGSIDDAGKTFVSETIKACDDKVGEGKPCTVALMAGFRNFPTDAVRIPYITKQLTATGRVKVLQMPDGQYARPGAQKATLDFFQTKPGVDVITTFADQMALGIVQALRQLGLTPGKDVSIIGDGATTAAVKGIKDGTWYASLGLFPTTQATLGIQYLRDAIDGKATPPTKNIYSAPGTLRVIDKEVLAEHPEFTGEWDG